MAGKQVALDRLCMLNPLKVGKNAYVLRVEEALVEKAANLGQEIGPDARKELATVMARYMLRTTMQYSEKEAKKLDGDVLKHFKRAAILLGTALGVCLLSSGLGQYAEKAGLERYAEICTVGTVGGLVVSFYGFGAMLEGGFSALMARHFRRDHSKLAEMHRQLDGEVAGTEIAGLMGPHWKS